MTRRTGAGASINPDHIAVHWAAIVLLAASLVAAGVASIDGLLHAALWMVPPAGVKPLSLFMGPAAPGVQVRVAGADRALGSVPAGDVCGVRTAVGCGGG